jgi:dolichyl-phosphate-mannose--protein O-mannosyl transferase
MTCCPTCWKGDRCKLIRWLALRVFIAVLLFAATVHIQQSIESTIDVVVDSQSKGARLAVQWSVAITFMILLIVAVYRLDLLAYDSRPVEVTAEQVRLLSSVKQRSDQIIQFA